MPRLGSAVIYDPVDMKLAKMRTHSEKTKLGGMPKARRPGPPPSLPADSTQFAMTWGLQDVSVNAPSLYRVCAYKVCTLLHLCPDSYAKQ